MADVIKRFGDLWTQMALSQRLILVSLVGAILITLLLFFTWLGREDYTLLYSNLAPEDAARVIEVLQKNSVDYRVTGGGNGVMIPAARVGEMKVLLAGEGLPTGGLTGYELFDDQGLGVSEFTQNVNYRRAQEGELARSIGAIKGVEKARVHLVIPKPALFKEDRRPPSASVVLNLSRPGALRPDQVQAVQRLVASSVEGLAPEQVTILDSFGNLISRDAFGEAGGMSTAQLELRQQVESYLARKAQSTLESVLGAGSALVRVNAELDFEKVERTREVVDPEVSAVLSENRSQSQRESDGETTESSTVNYEFNRLVESIVGATGGVEQIAVAVLIDGTYREEDGETTYVPRSPQELEGYRKIVENIVGFDAERGDRIEVLNVQFTDASPIVADGGLLGGGLMQKIPSFLNRALFVVALLFLLVTFRKMASQLVENISKAPAPAPVAAPEEMPSMGMEQKPVNLDGLIDHSIKDEAEQYRQMEEQAKALALDRPEDIAQLVRTWIYSKG